MKKTLSILLAIAVILTMSIPMFAFAEGEATTGSITMDKTTVGHTYAVYQIFTGTVNGEKLEGIKYGKSFKGKTAGDDAAKADIDLIAGGVDKALAAIDTENPYIANVDSAAGSTVISDLPFGYYLVQETTTDLPEGESATSFIVQLVGAAKLNIKAEVTTFNKEVMNYDDKTKAELWGKVADYDKGDLVPFKLTATLPSAENYQYYESYKLVFHDTLSDGLTYDEETADLEIKIGETVVTDKFTKTVEGQKITLSCADVKTFAEAGESIVVTYKAKLNDNAVKGKEGNPNEAYVEFSNKPDNSGDPTTNTPKKKVIVFTFGVDANKVSAAGDELVGATFELFKMVYDEEKEKADWKSLGKIKGTDKSLFQWDGVDAGDYKLVEVEAPEGYIAIEDIEFTVDPEYTDGELTSLNGEEELIFKGDVTTGIVSSDIVNTSSKELPTTGGIGTTIFYVLGAVLVLGAAILLIARRRAGAR